MRTVDLNHKILERDNNYQNTRSTVEKVYQETLAAIAFNGWVGC